MNIADKIWYEFKVVHKHWLNHHVTIQMCICMRKSKEMLGKRITQQSWTSNDDMVLLNQIYRCCQLWIWQVENEWCGISKSTLRRWRQEEVRHQWQVVMTWSSQDHCAFMNQQHQPDKSPPLIICMSPMFASGSNLCSSPLLSHSSSCRQHWC